jgi:hypothetical protein
MVQYVMQVDLDALDPELRPENESEKRKAEVLWANRADLFLEATEPAPLTVELPQPKMEEQEAQMEDPSIQDSPEEGSEVAPVEGDAAEETEATEAVPETATEPPTGE